MAYEIKLICPHCKKETTIRLFIVDRLKARIRELERQLKSGNDLQSLRDIFKV